MNDKQYYPKAENPNNRMNEATMIQLAKRAWSEIGDCELENWKVGNGAARSHVTAVGKPPRCRKQYLHAFLFSELGNDRLALVSTIRNIKGQGIKWLCNGQATKGKQVAFWGEAGAEYVGEYHDPYLAWCPECGDLAVWTGDVTWREDVDYNWRCMDCGYTWGDRVTKGGN